MRYIPVLLILALCTGEARAQNWELFEELQAEADSLEARALDLHAEAYELEAQGLDLDAAYYAGFAAARGETRQAALGYAASRAERAEQNRRLAQGERARATRLREQDISLTLGSGLDTEMLRIFAKGARGYAEAMRTGNLSRGTEKMADVNARAATAYEQTAAAYEGAAEAHERAGEALAQE